jgi:hypothetical protein
MPAGATPIEMPAEGGGAAPPVTTHPILLRVIRVPLGRRASGFVLVAICLPTRT